MTLTLRRFGSEGLNEWWSTSQRFIDILITCCNLLQSTSTIDLIITDERSAMSSAKFETHYLSPVYEEEAQYFHVPITVEFEFEYVLRKERKFT